MASLVASSSRCALTTTSRSASLAARYASTQSTSSATLPPSTPVEETVTPTTSKPSVRAQSIFVSLLLSRQPVITRDPTPLETSYFHYNHALQRRLAQPFSKDFYFRKGSAAETRFDEEEAKRRQEIDGASSASSVPSLQQEDSSLTSRRTPADEANDTSSLHRALDRSLFLAFRQKGSPWGLPRTRVDLDAGETLHKVALRPLEEQLGAPSADKMDAWLVSHLPVGVWPKPDGTDVRRREKTYFLRAHLISGSPAKESATTEYAWLTSEELAEKLESDQWEGIKDLLSE